MEKLYYENQYIKDFTAEVVDIIEKDNKFHIELDKTYFYPQGGGQPSDTGYIESIPVTFVYEKDEHIYHVTSKKPIKIHKLKCSIDWEKRFDGMQQHLGEHFLTYSFRELFGCANVGFHIGEYSSTIDLDKILDENQVQKAMDMANDIIVQNLEVKALYPSKSELKKLPIKKALPKTDSQIRIVQIGEIDYNPCCGIHPKSTIEVQMIKVKKFEKYKGGTRVEFLCGKRALIDSFDKDRLIHKICTKLNCNENTIIDTSLKLSNDFNKLANENRSLKSKISDYEVKDMIDSCEKINDISVIKEVYQNQDAKYINLLSSKLTSFENVIALFGIKNENSAQLIFSSSKNLKSISMNTLLKDAITLIDGKGGGSDFSAQGGGKNINNLESALDYAYMKIKQAF